MAPRWYEHALKDKGLKEIPGQGANPRIVEMFTHTTYHAKSDEVSWCAAGMCCWLEECGIPSTHSAAAISYETYGTKLTELRQGAILVFKRRVQGRPDARHVTFCSSEWTDTHAYCFGANQHNMADYSWMPLKDLEEIRWPKGEPL
jgi:uncharacterized protein (TIGR02594 family)